jgi:hypothetical protein
MSKVFSFRLDENNPREAQAREVIDAWVSKGYALRQVITDALLSISKDGEQSEDLDILLEQLRELVNQGFNKPILESTEGNKQILSTSFLNGIRKAKKDGLEAE